MRTPEENKKWDEKCKCIEKCFADVLTYIQHLEETIDSLGRLNATMHDEAKNGILALESRLAQVERENKAMLHDMSRYTMCGACKRFADRESCYANDECVYGEIGRFEWRGVCEENTKEE